MPRCQTKGGNLAHIDLVTSLGLTALSTMGAPTIGMLAENQEKANALQVCSLRLRHHAEAAGEAVASRISGGKCASHPLGSVVWAKSKGYPFWPSLVVTNGDAAGHGVKGEFILGWGEIRGVPKIIKGRASCHPVRHEQTLLIDVWVVWEIRFIRIPKMSSFRD
jgi:hypothetical protein